MSIRQASEQYAVPYTTLQNRLTKRYSTTKMGRPTALSEEEEHQLVEGLLQCAKWGFPLKSVDVRDLVQIYLNHKGVVEKRFRNNRPGRDWVKGLLKRNQQLTVRLSENIKRSRDSVSHDLIKTYFENLRVVVDNVPPSNIVNYDETNFTDDPGQVKVLVKKGTKHAERIQDTSKTSISVMIACAADGTVLPPYTVYKAKHLYLTWTEGGLNGSGYNRNSSGWFDMTMFEDWFSSILLPYFRKLEGKKVMIGDNLSSHLSLEVIRECQKHEIQFTLLPANSTHICQPLDVAFFRPLKIAWRSVLDNWKQRNRGVLPKSEFPRLLKETFEKIGIRTANNVIAGFRKTGIMPFNPDRVLSLIPKTEAKKTNTSWTSAFVSHLEKGRMGSPSGTKPRVSRAKKIDVQPGKSVIIREETDDSESELSNDDIEDDSENEDIEKENEDPEIQEFEDQENQTNGNKEDKEIAMETEAPSIEINKYVLVGFPTNKRFRKFVGRVIEIINDGCKKKFKIDFMRKKLNSKQNYFYFPDVRDVSEVTADQIIEDL